MAHQFHKFVELRGFRGPRIGRLHKCNVARVEPALPALPRPKPVDGPARGKPPQVGGPILHFLLVAPAEGLRRIRPGNSPAIPCSLSESGRRCSTPTDRDGSGSLPDYSSAVAPMPRRVISIDVAGGQIISLP